MERGRKPTPAAMLKLQGSYRATRHARRQVEPRADGELADIAPPAWMTMSQKRHWRQILKDAPKGILRRADRRMFINYVVLTDRFETAARTQNQIDARTTTPLLARGAVGAVISPYIRIMDRCTLLMTQLGAELGFSPTARARLGRPEQQHPADDGGVWAELRRFPRLPVIEGGNPG